MELTLGGQLRRISVLNIFLLVGLLTVLCSVGRAQSFNGNLSTGVSACASPPVASTAYVYAPVGSINGGVTVTLGGTFSGTVSFFASGDGATTWKALNLTPSNSGTAASTATATGIWQGNVAGYTHICVVFTTATSGTVVTTINLSNASARSSGGGGGAPSGAAGGDLAGTYPNPTIATTGASAASCGDTTHSCSLTVNTKGQITANSNNTIAASALTSTQVGYGSGSNLLTGDANLTWDATNRHFYVVGLASASQTNYLAKIVSSDANGMYMLPDGAIQGYNNTGGSAHGDFWGSNLGICFGAAYALCQNLKSTGSSATTGFQFYDYAGSKVTAFIQNNGNSMVNGQFGAATLDSATVNALAYGTETIGGVSVNTLATLTSLRAFKGNIRPLVWGKRSALDEVMSLRPISYTSKICKAHGPTTPHGCKELGLIAEEVAKTDVRLTTNNNKGELQGVQYDRTGVLAIAAIQELTRRVEQLEKELAK